jgi:hypothetical protein
MIAASWWAASSRGSSGNTRQHNPARLRYLLRQSRKHVRDVYACVVGGWAALNKK